MSKSILDEIVETKKVEIREAQKRIPLGGMRQRAEAAPAVGRSFYQAMTEGASPRIIAEIKRASPSKGKIAPDLDAAVQAAAYERGGAAALSVLTDGPYFLGSIDDLTRARSATDLPLLRKEFIISEYQIFEARAYGADAVLLIVRILSPKQLTDYLALTRSLGMDALVEIHTEEDLAALAGTGARIIGINNRNLVSFDTDIGRAVNLASRLETGQVPVAASGIAGREDIEKNLSVGIENFLIGESLVRAEDPAEFLRYLRNTTR